MAKILKIGGISIFLLAIIIVLLFGYRDIPLEDLKTKYATAPSSFVAVDGMNVHFRDEGDSTDATPIVLIHGTGSSLHTFDDWTRQLKNDHRVIRMDLPAYGLTGPFPDRNYSMDHYVNFIKNFLNALGIKKCVLGGNSLGGGIAWNFTTKYPDMVDKLILIDAAGYPTKAERLPLAFKLAQTPFIKNIFTYITPRFVAKASVENVFADKTKVTETLIDRYFELTLRKGNRQAFVDRLNTKKEISTHQNIALIKQQTLVLWGEQDQLIPVENALQFHDDLPNDTLVIMKNVGHVPMEERPNQSLESVLLFLKKE
ncbi:alpha/beta hydrolase [Flavobacteriaceae bacterium]|nr:alpha/beta hydrolase [Flavobacteriaceae bacterium]